MTKLIGITSRLVNVDNTEKQFVNTHYVDPLIKRNLNTVMLTLNNPNIEAILMLCDGFLITGGTDINPTNYNQTNQGLSINTSELLDKLDKLVIMHAYKHKKPLLGICRGHQALNVFLGGTLHQDLQTKNKHHKRVVNNHLVNTLFHDLFKFNKTINVNSYHHQAIDKLADDLIPLAFHQDETIEMVIHKNLPMFSVQWHPELQPDSPESKIVFDAFAALVNNK